MTPQGFRILKHTKLLLILTLVIAMSAATASTAYAKILKGPYVQQVNKTSTVIMWQTENATVGTVEWGETADLGQTNSSDPGTIHEVKIEGLSKNSQYHYRVKSDGDESNVYKFKTAPDAFTPFRFISFGDSRSGYDVHTRAVGAFLLEEPDIYMNSGDIVGSGTDEVAWQKHFEIEQELISSTLMMPSIGNHDTEGLTVGLYKKYFSLPSNGIGENYEELFYYQDWGSTRFISIENEISTLTMGSTQYDWLMDVLEDAKEDPQILHIFIMTHKGPFTATPGRSANMHLRALTGLLKNYNVQAILSGHDHHYYRGQSADEMDFIVTGGGGAGLYDCEPTNDWGVTNISWSKDYNYVVFDIDGVNMSATTKTLDGEIIETFEWHSAKPMPDPPVEDGDSDTDVSDGDEDTESDSHEVTATISAIEGGNVEANDSSASLDIPVNAIDIDTAITMKQQGKVGYPEAGRLASKVYDFSPADLSFNKAATISISLTDSIPESYEAKLVSLQNDEWTIVDGSVVSSDMVHAEIDNLGTYAVYLEGDGPIVDGDDVEPDGDDTADGDQTGNPADGSSSGCNNVNSVPGFFLIFTSLFALLMIRRKRTSSSI